MRLRALLMLTAMLALSSTGCGYIHRVNGLYEPPPPVRPLGMLNDRIWENQEANGEASDFVVYQHEWDLNTTRLNRAGMDHVRQIAARIHEGGQQVPVIIERSLTTKREESTEYAYPVHENPAMDMERRAVVVRALEMMQIPNADQMVVVSPALRPGFKASEAQQAYAVGISNRFGGFGGFGGFGSGLGFGGGFGGFGGGFFR